MIISLHKKNSINERRLEEISLRTEEIGITKRKNYIVLMIAKKNKYFRYCNKFAKKIKNINKFEIRCLISCI